MSYPTSIIGISALAGSLYLAVDVLQARSSVANSWATPYVVIAISFLGFFFFAVIAAVVSLVKFNLASFASYLASACVLYASWQAGIYASAAVKGDRFVFPSAAHDEIAKIWSQRRPATGLKRPGYAHYWVLPAQKIFDELPDLVALGDECHPPSGCECWIARGAARDRGIEKDVGGGWHVPRSGIFPAARPDYFAIVHVRRIDGDAYSVLGCVCDWGALIPC